MKSMDKLTTGVAYGTSVDWPPESPDNQYHLFK